MGTILCEWHTWADIAAILTFLGAFLAYVRYEVRAVCKRWKLEEYLREEKSRVLAENKDKPAADRRDGKFSIVHIMRDVGLTEDEIIQASFRSRKIKRFVTNKASTNIADDLLFQYVD